MAIRYGKFELPSKVKLDETVKKTHFARFIAEPFERGFGHTMGNALRRIMLTSLEAPAIISVCLEGVPHEYMAIEGVIEDMTHIILNLKGTLLRKIPTDEQPASREPFIVTKTLDVTPQQLEKGGGQHAVTLREIMEGSQVEVINPDHVIFTATKPQVRRISLKIGIGRGYVASERHIILDKKFDEIIIDSAFSPVRLVNYYVENTRVGQDTDFDRLILEVTTDGRITPEESLFIATQIAILHFEVIGRKKPAPLIFDSGHAESNTDRDTVMSKLALNIDEIELSVRSANCLKGANINTIAELVLMPESEMLKFRNFGKKSLSELRDKLAELGLSLPMDLTRFGITRENVKSVIDEYIQEKMRKES
jgi:DNA-directed RNA polymerase subunit alpha